MNGTVLFVNPDSAMRVGGQAANASDGEPEQKGRFIASSSGTNRNWNQGRLWSRLDRFVKHEGVNVARKKELLLVATPIFQRQSHIATRLDEGNIWSCFKPQTCFRIGFVLLDPQDKKENQPSVKTARTIGRLMLLDANLIWQDLSVALLSILYNLYVCTYVSIYTHINTNMQNR